MKNWWRFAYLASLFLLVLFFNKGGEWGWWNDRPGMISVLGSFASLFALIITIIELLLTQKDLNNASLVIKNAEGEVTLAKTQVGEANAKIEAVESKMIPMGDVKFSNY